MKDKLQDFVDSLGIKPGMIERVIVHWTGGAANPNAVDRKAYHALVSQGLSLYRGVFSPEDNMNPKPGQYAAHTAKLNTKSFGLALCGMLDAKERPFKPGPYPITEDQFILSARLAARILIAAGLECTERTALSHAEVQEVLGVKQKSKWDIAWLPTKESEIFGARQIGKYWRLLIQAELNKLQRKPFWQVLLAALKGLFK